MTLEDRHALTRFAPFAWLPVQAADVAWEEAIARVCVAYPFRVSMTFMSQALDALQLDPEYVEQRLLAGKTIGELDAQLADVREAW